MNVAVTSIESYEDVISEGRLPQQHARVLAAIGTGALSRAQIAAVTGLPTASVCGRVHELMGKGVLETYDTIPSPYTGRSVHRVCLSADRPKNDGAIARAAIASKYDERREEIAEQIHHQNQSHEYSTSNLTGQMFYHRYTGPEVREQARLARITGEVALKIAGGGALLTAAVYAVRWLLLL